MSKKQIKIMKSIVAIITAISINACCMVQAYALPEPSPDWWQAATVIVGGAAAKGTAVVSAPVVIGSVIVALGVCAGAWAVTHPDEFCNVVNGVKSRISNLLVGKDDSGMLVQMDEGVPYLDEESLDQIAQALHDGGYLSSNSSQPDSSNGASGGTYVIDSLTNVPELLDYICSFYSQWNLNVWYDNYTKTYIYTNAPYLVNNRYLMFVNVNDGHLDIGVSTNHQVNSSVSLPLGLRRALTFEINTNQDSGEYGLIKPSGSNPDIIRWHTLGLVTEDLDYPNGQFSNANWSASVDYGKTDNAVQVDGDTVTIPEWAGDIKETINELGDTIKNYPIALPSGTAIPYIFPDTTPEADIKTMVQDVPIPEDKPIPDIAEEGRTQEEVQNPDPDKPIETLPEEPLTESTLPSLKLPAALAQRFPFSLVSDINVLVSKLSGTGEAPHFSIPVKIDIANIDTSIDVDLSMFSGAVSVIRPVILACAVLGIIRLTFKVINV